MSTTVVKPKWAIFPVWAGVVYCSYIAVIAAVALFKDGVPFSLFVSLRGQALLLFPSIIPAAIGTIGLSLLPIRSSWVGGAVGLLLGTVGLALGAWAEIKLLGSFEANPGIVLQALLMLVPNWAAGAYAGFAWASFHRQQT